MPDYKSPTKGYNLYCSTCHRFSLHGDLGCTMCGNPLATQMIEIFNRLKVIEQKIGLKQGSEEGVYNPYIEPAVGIFLRFLNKSGNFRFAFRNLKGWTTFDDDIIYSDLSWQQLLKIMKVNSQVEFTKYWEILERQD